MGMPFHMQPFSPTSSPTTVDFPPPSQQQQQSQVSHTNAHHHNLARTHSLQHIPYDTNYASSVRYDQQQQVVMELDESDPSSDRKRQRTGITVKTEAGVNDGTSRRLARARSDSAPLGYGIGTGLNQTWAHTGHIHAMVGNRPRSGTNLAAPRGVNRREEVLNLSGNRSVSAVCTTQATSPLANVPPKIGS